MTDEEPKEVPVTLPGNCRVFRSELIGGPADGIPIVAMDFGDLKPIGFPPEDAIRIGRMLIDCATFTLREHYLNDDDEEEQDDDE